jgi:hypothetical protein
MAAHDIVPVPGARLEEALESASPDLLGEMIKGFAQRKRSRQTRQCAVSDVPQPAAMLRRLVLAVGLSRLWV